MEAREHADPGFGLASFFCVRQLGSFEALDEANLSSWRHEPSGKIAPILVGYTGIAVAGYRFICSCGLVLDLAADVVVLHLPSARVATVDGFVSSEALTRVYPTAELNVGWTFWFRPGIRAGGWRTWDAFLAGGGRTSPCYHISNVSRVQY